MEGEVIDFIRLKLGYIVLDTSESFDLIGIDGLDSETFFYDFERHFDVNMTSFDFDRYFSGEDLFHSLLRNKFKYLGKQKHFSIKHLIEVVERSEWFDPV
ncbi:DUF1493 family protein [Tenacibaculum singaporense]|uniref:DUF1493 family protein n=1 Tax=Tenacibaculum singaporense TaxID=2358479 RepID=UPI00142DC130|nr:DUF1493 family protein [Tenacibaculum singaporense]